MKKTLFLRQMNDYVYAVFDAHDHHVGQLKLIGTVWKFKAVGYTTQGALVPGGGPFTHKHNAVFDEPDEADLSSRLLSNSNETP